jgi:hypothetical protein
VFSYKTLFIIIDKAAAVGEPSLKDGATVVVDGKTLPDLTFTGKSRKPRLSFFLC